MTQAISCSRMAQLSAVIAAQMGLHFPRARWRDLERGVCTAARELGFPDVAACVQYLVSSPLTQHQIGVLAGHLTVGETYFFRDPHVFTLLEEEILPALMHARRGHAHRLHLWSAGCATGEEPYSMAISVSKVIPDVQDWDITLLATDINPGFLQRASVGVYREWSFRETPPGLRAHYFSTQQGGRWAILPATQTMVKFAYLNLIDDVYPSSLNNTMAMDVIFCRNVLMYLAPEQAKKVVQNLHGALAEGGWLIVSASETSQVLFASFQTVNILGAILYRKASTRSPSMAAVPPQAPRSQTPAAEMSEPWPSALPDVEATAQEVVPRQTGAADAIPAASSTGLPQNSYMQALELYQQGRYGEVANRLSELCAPDHTNAQAMALLARACANQGRLAEARQWCERALAADSLNAGLYYLRSAILQEQGALEETTLALKRTLYLDPHFVLAHFALGTLVLQQGRLKEAGKHFEHALSFLSARQQDEILPESDGMTAGRLREIIASMSRKHTSP
jgi:chemotaxis protein methyltransferase CheR